MLNFKQALDGSIQCCETMPNRTKDVTRVLSALRDIATKTTGTGNSGDRPLTPPHPDAAYLQPLVDPFFRLQHVLRCMDDANGESARKFLEELEDVLYDLIGTLDAISKSAPTISVDDHATRLDRLISEFNGNDDTESVTQVETDADRAISEGAPVRGLELKMNGATFVIKKGGIANGNVGLDKADMSKGFFNLTDGSVGCDNISSNASATALAFARMASTSLPRK